MVYFKYDGLASMLHETDCYSLFDEREGDFIDYNYAKVIAKVDRVNCSIQILHQGLTSDILLKVQRLLLTKSDLFKINHYSFI